MDYFHLIIMRCFIGVPLPESVRRRLIKAQKCFSGVDARLTLVGLNNMHVSLHFLGEVDNLLKVNELLSGVKFNSFKASVKDVAFFPSRGYIRVIHSPVNLGRSEFVTLHSLVNESLNLSPEERFNPHVTLARVKFVKSTNVLSRACFNERFEEIFDVNSFNAYCLTWQHSCAKILLISLKPSNLQTSILKLFKSL